MISWLAEHDLKTAFDQYSRKVIGELVPLISVTSLRIRKT
jgi:hypothetical protein